MTRFITQKDLLRESMKRINYKVVMKLPIQKFCLKRHFLEMLAKKNGDSMNFSILLYKME